MESSAILSAQAIYLMGGCFVLGSVVTLLLLLILDKIRHMQLERTQEEDTDAP